MKNFLSLVLFFGTIPFILAQAVPAVPKKGTMVVRKAAAAIYYESTDHAKQEIDRLKAEAESKLRAEIDRLKAETENKLKAKEKTRKEAEQKAKDVLKNKNKL
jgi:hypothetical protein